MNHARRHNLHPPSQIAHGLAARKDSTAQELQTIQVRSVRRCCMFLTATPGDPDPVHSSHCLRWLLEQQKRAAPEPSHEHPHILYAVFCDHAGCVGETNAKIGRGQSDSGKVDKRCVLRRLWDHASICVCTPNKHRVATKRRLSHGRWFNPPDRRSPTTLYTHVNEHHHDTRVRAQKNKYMYVQCNMDIE